MKRCLFLLPGLLACLPASLRAGDVVIVDNGTPRAALFVPARLLDDPTKNPESPIVWRTLKPEDTRRRLRESVKDLAAILGRISGAKIDVVAGKPAAGERRLPILVGELAMERFGKPAKSFPFGQGFRIIVSPTGVGLAGELDLGTSYAIYTLLDQLGCRWFMPGPRGEVLPALKTIRLREQSTDSGPYTIYRGLWYCDSAFARRNRLGGMELAAGHALEYTVPKELRKTHPEIRAIIQGKPHDHLVKWTHPLVAKAISDSILDSLKKDPTQKTFSLSPDDGATWDESDDAKHDAGDFDPAAQAVSKTDRLMVLVNGVARAVGEKHPDVRLGVLAYADYIRPPVREKVPVNVVPQVAPITFSRAQPMSDDGEPNNKALRALVEGWAKAAPATSYYFYAYNLAELSGPNPMIAKWGHDIPFIYSKGGCKYWQPETLPNFETSLHAHWLGMRLAWDPKQEPAALVKELNGTFYGHAGSAMAAYWQHIDDTWAKVPEHAGCGFGHLRRWMPERLGKARALLDRAKGDARTPMEKERIELAAQSFAQFEKFMQMRRDLAEGKFADLAESARDYRAAMIRLGEKQQEDYCFGRMGWTGPNTIHVRYFDAFYRATYDAAARIAAQYRVLTEAPLRRWRYHPDKEKKGEAAGWGRPDFDDVKWQTTDCVVDTWSALGLHNYMGSLWYRTKVSVPPVAPGKRVFLWVGSTDGRVKVFVNGTHVPHVNDKGVKADSVSGYCQPVSFDVSKAIRPGGENQVSLLCTRETLNELGTGGLLAPVVLYADREGSGTGWLQATAHLVPKETAPEGEGYFSLIEGLDRRLYIGTHANAVNSWLVEFDPESRQMRVVVDAHKAIGVKTHGFAAQAKIHTRNNVGASGKIYFGTKQGYPDKDEKYVVYPGGYPMAYDPKTGKTEVFPIPVPHQGINSITPDESRGVAYVSTCSDGKPGPGENAIFLKLDLKTGKYTPLMDTQHIFGFIVVDNLGRAYHPILGGDVARYDPATGKLDRLAQTIDGKPPAPGSHLADAKGHPINWDISPDRKTLYSVPMSGNRLYAYDLTALGATLPGRDLGPLLPKAKDTDCRAMCVGPSGRVWSAITENVGGVHELHLVSYRSGDKGPRDRGRVAVRNPDYTTFTDRNGKPLPFHGGLLKRPDGITMSRYVVLGVCEGRDGSVSALMLHPYTLLQVGPEQLADAAPPK
jgi:sugar lactone lactonase YvrE